MKNRLLIIAMIASMGMSTRLSAQQSLWEGKQPETAIVNADKSVTIQVYAPAAGEIRLEGELTNQSTLMNRDSVGLWTYTTSPLAADLYLYYLKIDGVRALDPGNSFVARDIASLFSYVLVDDYCSMDIPHGTIEKVWPIVEDYSCGRRMSVYLPAGYEDNKSQRYPVLYLLHGSGGDEDAWMELGRVAQTMDYLIGGGHCKPMIVVMPNGNYSEDAAPGLGRKGNVKPGVPQEHRMDGLYESRFHEIIEYVDSHYRTKRNAQNRAIAGLSMGGYHTYWIALNNPKTFGWIAPFSAVYHSGEMKEDIYQNEQQKLLLLKKQNPHIHIFIGSDDFLYEQNVEKRKLLDEMGVGYQYTESTGGHQWKNWRRYLESWVKELF